MAVTIKDIAQHLNLAPSTVSKALNNYPHISEETKMRVLAASAELGYIPSAAARNLRRQRTDKIGFVFNIALSYINDYFAEVIAGATLAAEENDHNIILYTHEGDSPTSLLNLYRKREVDGFILIWHHVSVDMINMLMAEDVPFVILGRRVNHPQASYITPDNYKGARSLMQHLLDLGHTRIGFTTRPEMKLTHEDRFNAYKDALAEANISFDPTLVVETKIEPNSGYLAMNELLDLAEPPTAVFAFHDLVAVDAQKAILEHGLTIPGDIALAGFDGLTASLITSPPITTVKQPLREIGKQSILALLSRIENNNQPPIRITLPVQLIPRESTLG